MKELVITAGNGKTFGQLKNFVVSLRSYGEYSGSIAICDNEISGTWNNPGTWNENPSFSKGQLDFFHEQNVRIFPIQELMSENKMPEEVIRSIKSPTQRYPYKFIYTTLISKYYLNSRTHAFYFDSDIYFQTPFKPISEQAEPEKILIVKEWLKMKNSTYLAKWISFSDFSSISSQGDYLSTMLEADDFCSGFYGGDITTFHRFNLLALLLTSNQFVHFFSDQPLVNILKTFFHYPFKELDCRYCLHLGELKENDYSIRNGKFVIQDQVPVCVHFNSGKYRELEFLLENGYQLPVTKITVLKRIKSRLGRILR